MKISFEPRAWEEYQFFIMNEKKLIKKINQLLDDIKRNPFEGIGKPEPLKHELLGLWSRRITDEHRLVYKISDEQVDIVSCKSYYDN